MTKLPDKLSELTELALHDLSLCERSKKYMVDMGHWHEPDRGLCYVCLAGSVMAKTLKTPVESYRLPYHFDEENKLSALNYIREGEVDDACYYFYDDVPANLQDFYVIPYEDNPTQFKRDIRKIIRYLKKRGL